MHTRTTVKRTNMCAHRWHQQPEEEGLCFIGVLGPRLVRLQWACMCCERAAALPHTHPGAAPCPLPTVERAQVQLRQVEQAQGSSCANVFFRVLARGAGVDAAQDEACIRDYFNLPPSPR